MTDEYNATEVALARLPDFGGVEQLFLFPQGSLKHSGLELTNPDMQFEDWQKIGHLIGFMSRWSKFALGDWLNFGAAIFGEDYAQGVEGTPSERYDVAHRITGLEVATLQNYASICGRIALSTRRIELNFSMHEPVAGLEPEEQGEWLDRAVTEGWTREELRIAIKEAKNPQLEPGDQEVVDSDDGSMTISERIEQAARLVYGQAQVTSEGGAIVPAEPWHQLAAALGESD